MTLTLTVLRCPDAVPPETRRVQGGEFTIGRGHDNDWVMPDAERHLSKRHCVLAFRSGGWHVADVSSNGTFLNTASEPLGPGATQSLRDGDRLRLGQYEIEVRIDEPDAFRPESSQFGGARGSGGSAPYRDDPFAIDPFAGSMGTPAPQQRPSPFSGGGGTFESSIGGGGIGLPADFDPLAPEPGDPAFLSRPTQSDHTPATADAFRPPPVAATGIPDDWDFEGIGQPAPPPAAAPALSPAAPPPPPVQSAPLPPTLRVEPQAPPEPAQAPPPPSYAPQPAYAASPQDAGLMAAFLRGAEMEGVAPADPAATMEQLGATFRALVSGIRQTLIARAAVKGEFRIEQTRVSKRGNNPLKFSADDDDAMSALLGAGRRTEMSPAVAVSDALRDIRLHELASVAAMQAAVRALVDELEPGRIRDGAGEAGGLNLPGQRRARWWDAYEALHAKVSQALADDFDSVFGKNFARAYEQALADAAGKEPR